MSSMADLGSILEEYCRELRVNMEEAWSAQSIDLADTDRIEVLGGLASRQYRLVTTLVSTPQLWDFDLGMILVRCMVETKIHLSYLARSATPEELRNFIEYGWGQEKLAVQHLKSAHSAAIESDPEFREMLEDMENSISEKVQHSFITVNLGDWTKRSDREMALATENDENYNLLYRMGSFHLHGSWNSIVRYNLRFCRNPMHKQHFVLDLDPPENFTLECVNYATRLMDETFGEWTKAIGVSVQSQATENLKSRVEKLTEGLASV